LVEDVDVVLAEEEVVVGVDQGLEDGEEAEAVVDGDPDLAEGAEVEEEAEGAVVGEAEAAAEEHPQDQL